MRVASHDAHSTAPIFLPFPKRNVISAEIKTKAQTNLFWGNFQLFTCQAELLKMPDWSDTTADSNWNSQRQTNYRGALQLEREQKTSAKYSNTNIATFWGRVMCTIQSILATITDSAEINIAFTSYSSDGNCKIQNEKKKTFMSASELLFDNDISCFLKNK